MASCVLLRHTVASCDFPWLPPFCRCLLSHFDHHHYHHHHHHHRHHQDHHHHHHQHHARLKLGCGAPARVGACLGCRPPGWRPRPGGVSCVACPWQSVLGRGAGAGVEEAGIVFSRVVRGSPGPPHCGVTGARICFRALEESSR